MPLENSNTVAGLNPTWPLGSDPKSQGDDHLRLIKNVLQQDAATLSGDNQAALIKSKNFFIDNQFAPRWRASIGSETLPGFAFEGNGSWNTGLFETTGGSLGFSVLGSSRMDLSTAQVIYKASITSLRWERSDAGVNFDFPNRANNDQGLIINFRSSGNTSRYTMRGDGGLSSTTDVVNRLNGDGRYARLTANNTFTGFLTTKSFEETGAGMNLKRPDGESFSVRLRAPRQDQGVVIEASAGYPNQAAFNFDVDFNQADDVVTKGRADANYQRSTSDAAMKENVKPLGDMGDVIDALQPCEYTWKPNEMDPQPGGVQIGAIAQEVEAVLPSAVRGEDGNKAIDLRPVVWALVKEMQTLRQRLAVVEA